MTIQNHAYSFLDVTASIEGPGGSGTLSGGGVADEGISVEPDERVETQYGAGGEWMHVLKGRRGGRIVIRLLKNGIANAMLSRMFNFDTGSSANVGRNTISVRNPQTGDSWVAIGCACRKMPNTVYSSSGPMLEWEFTVGLLSGILGTGSPTIQ